ncbi:MAG: hypothetical protein WKG07_05035 [Hymenobacter sp.]
MASVERVETLKVFCGPHRRPVLHRPGRAFSTWAACAPGAARDGSGPQELCTAS